MPIIINHNLCDEAQECGGIEVCPTGAFYFDKKKGKVAVDKSKCTECLKCTLPDACPVGCILYARNKDEEDKIRKRIKNDPRTAKWLWRERYGCQPAKTPPKAVIINKKNFDKIVKQKGYKLIDVWRDEDLDCRAYSVSFSDLLQGIKQEVDIFKLDAREYPTLSGKLNVQKHPTLLLYKDSIEEWRYEGLLKEKGKMRINKKLKEMII